MIEQLWLTLVLTKSQLAQKNEGISVHGHYYRRIFLGMVTNINNQNER